MVVHLSEESDLDVPLLVKTFGNYLFTRFVVLYPSFFENTHSCFDFLELIENHIHVEVKKLYPEAELPSFDTTKIDDNTLEMIYSSERPFAPVAEGLIEGAITYFKEQIDLQVEDLSGGVNNHAKFTLTKQLH